MVTINITHFEEDMMIIQYMQEAIKHILLLMI